MPCDKQVDENFQGIVITVDAGQAEAKPDRKEKADKKAVAQWQNGHECWPVNFIFIRQQAA